MSRTFSVTLPDEDLKEALKQYASSRGLSGLPSLALKAINEYLRRNKPSASQTALLNYLDGVYYTHTKED